MDNYEIKKAELKIQVLSSVAGAKGEEGESMYEIAKKNGFEGTEQEFIAQYMNVDARIGYYECDTDSSTVAKTVQGGNFILPTIPPYGGSFKVKFANKNSAANPTLSINQSTPKPLYYNGAIASASNTWEDGDVLDLYYDGTNFNATSVVDKFATGEKVKNVGIDSEPTAGSENLVKSGGVFNEIDTIKNQSFSVNLNLVETVPRSILKEDGTIEPIGNFSIKKYDIPEGTSFLRFNGMTGIESVYSILWIVNENEQKIFSVVGPGRLTNINTIIDLSSLTNPTQIWICISNYNVYYLSDLELSEEILALKNNEAIINSNSIVDSLFSITKYKESELQQTGRLKEDGTIETTSNKINVIDLPADIDKIYFTVYGSSSLSSSYSICWVVNSEGTKLASIPAIGGGEPHTYVGIEIDLSELSNPTQVWFAVSTKSFIQFYDYSNRVGKRIEDIETTTKTIEDSVEEIENNKTITNSNDIIDSLFAITKHRNSVLQQTGRLKEDGTIETASNQISVIDLPTGIDKIYFTLYGTSSLSPGYSICWVVDSEGTKLASIPAIGGGEPHTYVGIEIDLSELSNPTQVWFAVSTKSFIQFYDYSNRVEKRIEDVEKDIESIKTEIVNLNINNHWKDKKIVWLGTSIPWGEDGGSRCAHPYPSQVCAALGATLVDSTHGGLSQMALFTEAVYSVIKTTELTEEPSGTLLSTTPTLVTNSNYPNTPVEWLTEFPDLPTTQGLSKTYYIIVSGTTTTYTKWEITKTQYVNVWFPKPFSKTAGSASGGSTCLTIQECQNAVTAGLSTSNLSTYSYENTILNKNADLYVFDVEPNNGANGSDEDLALFDWRLWKYTDNSSFASHRDTYIGALIYEIDQLLTEKPDAVVVFVGEYVGMHLSNYQNVPYPIRALSVSLCEKFHIHYIDLAEKLFYTGKNMSVWLNGDELHPKQVLYDRIAKILINELLLIA